MGKIIGIDLGTTNSAFAYMVAGKPEVITNSEGDRTTPSVVAITKKGDRLVGKVAQRQRVTNPENTIYGIKRLIGRKYEDKEVQDDKKNVPFKITKSEKGDSVAVTLGGKDYSPEAVSAMILSKIKADAETLQSAKEYADNKAIEESGAHTHKVTASGKITPNLTKTEKFLSATASGTAVETTASDKFVKSVTLNKKNLVTAEYVSGVAANSTTINGVTATVGSGADAECLIIIAQLSTFIQCSWGC